MSKVADVATEVVAEAAEEVAEQATYVAEKSRRMTGRDAGLVFGGIVTGAGLGCAAAYFYLRKQLETKYQELAQEEIEAMREHYLAKGVALEDQKAKPELQDLVREKGYSTEAPMVVKPPESVLEASKESPPSEQMLTRVKVEPDDMPKDRNVFKQAPPTEEEIGQPLVEFEWDMDKERRRRSPVKPYVIHRDERDADAAYDEVTLTYYEEDDVLCNEADQVLDKEERDETIGEESLNRFGHGSLDANIVFVRNDRMTTIFEVVRSPNSYAEEVHGFTPEPDEPELRHSQQRGGRRRFDDDR